MGCAPLGNPRNALVNKNMQCRAILAMYEAKDDLEPLAPTLINSLGNGQKIGHSIGYHIQVSDVAVNQIV